MMHVLFARGLEDRDYLERHTLGHEALRERARASRRRRATAAITGLPRGDHRRRSASGTARASAAFIRVNYGLQRHAGGGMAVRTIACLPAITGHWRRAGRRRAALDVGELHVQPAGARAAGPRSPPARTINMIRLGEALTTPDAGVGGPPVRALVVYNSNPGRRRARPQHGAARAARARICSRSCSSTSRPTRADWADIVLPATTQLEHWDLHLAYGHHYVVAQPAVDRAAGRGAAEHARSSAGSPRGWA